MKADKVGARRMMTADEKNKVFKNLSSNRLARDVLAAYRERILGGLVENDPSREELTRAFDNAVPTDSYLVFMGFCPGADFKRRQDTRWRSVGICEFEFDGSETQVRRFATIRVGDQIILKKNQIRGKTMELYGHGKVIGVEYSAEGRRVLKMDWHPDEKILEVPLMGCTPTVSLKKTVAVLNAMPPEFHEWLYQGQFK